MNTVIRLAVAAGTVAAGLAWTAPVEAQTTTLRFNNFLPMTHWMNQRKILPWAKMVEEATQGRVKVELTASTLCPPVQQFECVRDGIADAALGIHGYSPGQFDLTRVIEIPGIEKTADAMGVALWRVHKAHLDKAGEHKGVHLITMWVQPPGILFTAKEPVTKIEDFKGRTLRVPTPAIVEVAKRFGATPVMEPATKVHELMSKGVVEGAFFNTDAWESYHLQKFVRALTEVDGGFYSASIYLIVNEKSWAKISAADRAKIMDCCAGEKMAAMFGKAWEEMVANARANMVKDGVKINVIQGAERDRMFKAMAFLQEDWIKLAASRGVDGKAAIQMLLDEQEKYAQSIKKTN
ncbi:MAG: TRAP transporter substrate-binding protein [Alphaproteobacteria bacterium]|nr:TRAP transporter substrate-binding protein [Alphaproteobacteria bacterium]